MVVAQGDAKVADEIDGRSAIGEVGLSLEAVIGKFDGRRPKFFLIEIKVRRGGVQFRPRQDAFSDCQFLRNQSGPGHALVESRQK